MKKSLLPIALALAIVLVVGSLVIASSGNSSALQNSAIPNESPNDVTFFNGIQPQTTDISSVFDAQKYTHVAFEANCSSTLPSNDPVNNWLEVSDDNVHWAAQTFLQDRCGSTTENSPANSQLSQNNDGLTAGRYYRAVVNPLTGQNGLPFDYIYVIARFTK